MTLGEPFLFDTGLYLAPRAGNHETLHAHAVHRASATAIEQHAFIISKKQARKAHALLREAGRDEVDRYLDFIYRQRVKRGYVHHKAIESISAAVQKRMQEAILGSYRPREPEFREGWFVGHKESARFASPPTFIVSLGPTRVRIDPQ